LPGPDIELPAGQAQRMISPSFVYSISPGLEDCAAPISGRASGRISFPGQNASPALPDLSRIVTQVTAKDHAGGATPGFFMTGHLRFCFAAFFLFTSLSPSPASSNPFADLFNVTPHAAPAPASAERECLSRHGKSTADGQHWVYRLDGHRKCWFQAAEGIATAKKRVYHHAAKQRAPAENETARHKREAVVDARELLRSAPAEASQPTPPASELKAVDAASVLATGAAPVANRATDQLTPDRPSPRQVDVETVLSAAWAPSDAVAASVPPGSPAAFPIAEAGDDGRGRTASWLGMLLMALGLVSVLSSSRVLRGAVPLRQRQ
jgi:hypothetical protein